MESVILSLPREGDLVRIPFLFTGNTWGNLAVAASPTAIAAVSASATTAAITYAKLRLLAVLVEVTVNGTAGDIHGHLRLNSISAAGGIPCLYGIQTTVVEQVGDNQAGFAKLFVPSLRDNPIIHVNQTVSAQVSIVNFITGAGQAGHTYRVAASAICERISDPEAQATP